MKRKVTILLYCLLFLSMLTVFAQKGEAQSVSLPWHDDLNYGSKEEMVSAGWTLSSDREDLLSVGGGVLTLDNDGAYGSGVQFGQHFPAGVYDFKVETRGRWIGRSYGTLQLVAQTQRHVYLWMLDGFYPEYVFARDEVKVQRFGGYMPQTNVWLTLGLEKRDNTFYMCLDGELRSTFTETDDDPDQLTGVALRSGWISTTEYDYVSVAECVRVALPWKDNFNYATEGEMKTAGWYLDNVWKISGGLLGLDNDGSKGSAAMFLGYFPLEVYEFTVETRSRWVGRSYGHNGNFYVYTERHWYCWFGDGFYPEYAFVRDGIKVLRFEGYAPTLNQWSIFTLEKRGNTFYMYENGELKNTYVETDTAPDAITGVHISCGWISTMEYDYISVSSPCYLEVKTNPPGIAAIAGEGWYSAFSTVTLTAPFASGSYLFWGWDVDGTPQGTTNPIDVYMDGNRTATAHYSDSAVGGEWAPIQTAQSIIPYVLLSLAFAGAFTAGVWCRPRKH